MAFKKKQKEKEDKNVISDPELRAKYKKMLVTLTEYYIKIDALKDGEKETVTSTASEYGLDKKTVRKMAKTMYNANYGSLLEENRHFEEMYELIVEGKLRDSDSLDSPDPLDDEEEDGK